MRLISNITKYEEHFHTFQIVINVRSINIESIKNYWNIKILLVHTFSLPLHLINYLNAFTCIRKFSFDIFYNNRYIEI